ALSRTHNSLERKAKRHLARSSACLLRHLGAGDTAETRTIDLSVRNSEIGDAEYIRNLGFVQCRESFDQVEPLADGCREILCSRAFHNSHPAVAKSPNASVGVLECQAACKVPRASPL